MGRRHDPPGHDSLYWLGTFWTMDARSVVPTLTNLQGIWISGATLAQGKKADLAFPFAFHAALGDQQQILDRLADGDMLTDLKHARHRQSSPDPIFSEPAQCRH